MAWLFERMIELGAWVAFILGVVFLSEAVYCLVQWLTAIVHLKSDPELTLASYHPLLLQSAQAAGAFVASALAVGALACIDRYVFDLPEPKPGK